MMVAITKVYSASFETPLFPSFFHASLNATIRLEMCIFMVIHNLSYYMFHKEV